MPSKLPGLIREKIWKEKLNAEFNYRCYDRIGTELSRWDFGFKLALAITSSSTVAFWVLVEPKEILWKALSAVSALIAVVSATLNYQQKIEYANSMKFESCKLWNEFEKLWLNIETRQYAAQKAIEEYAALREKIAALEKEKSLIEANKRIRAVCKARVLTNNDLKEPSNG